MHQQVQPPGALNIRLELASRAEEVWLARELLSGVADSLAAGIEQIDDIRTAVTEACNNVVQHAYDGTPGPIELDLALQDEALEVTVRDHGGGMHPWIRTPKSDTLGIGLMVIKALSESVEFRDSPDGGTEVQMRFSTPGLAALDPGEEIPSAPQPFDASSVAISVAIGPPPLAQTVLPRLLSAMAARAHFSTDRIADLQIVGDAIVAHCEPVIEAKHLCLRITASSRLVELSISPLLPGGAAQLLQGASMQGVGPVIERLSDEQETLRDGGTETLIVRMRDHR
jgi:serine/threonine-protein kinase RsbW